MALTVLAPSSGDLVATGSNAESAIAWVGTVKYEAAMAGSGIVFEGQGPIGLGMKGATDFDPMGALQWTNVESLGISTAGLVISVVHEIALQVSGGSAASATLGVQFQPSDGQLGFTGQSDTSDLTSGGTQTFEQIGEAGRGIFPSGIDGSSSTAQFNVAAQTWTTLHIFLNQLRITYEPVSVFSVTPNHGPVEGGTAVTIAGQHFLGASVATLQQALFGAFKGDDPTTFGNEPQPATDLVVVDDTHLTCTTPPRHPSWVSSLVHVGVAFVGDAFGQGSEFRGYNVFNYGSSGPAMWWYNPTANSYVFAAESPGAPFVAAEEPPTITITGVSPRST